MAASSLESGPAKIGTPPAKGSRRRFLIVRLPSKAPLGCPPTAMHSRNLINLHHCTRIQSSRVVLHNATACPSSVSEITKNIGHFRKETTEGMQFLSTDDELLYFTTHVQKIRLAGFIVICRLQENLVALSSIVFNYVIQFHIILSTGPAFASQTTRTESARLTEAKNPTH